MTKDDFKKEIMVGQKKSRFDVVFWGFFLLNTLCQIQSSSYLYCYCNEEKKIKMSIVCNSDNFFGI